MLSKEGLRDYFDKELSKKLKADNIKAGVCKGVMLLSLLIFMTSLIWAIVLLFGGKFNIKETAFIPIAALLSISVLLLVFIYYTYVLRDLEKRIVAPVLHKIFEGNKIIYDKNRNLGKKELAESGFVDGDNYRVDGEDYLELDFESNDHPVNIKVSDVRVVVSQLSSDGNVRSRVADRGVFGIIDFNREVKTEILGNFNKRGFEALELESEDFNKVFTCYTKDQIEARKVLTPRTMARLLKLQDKIDDRPRFHLSGTKLYFLLDKDLFKYKIKGLVDFGEAEQIYDQVYIIYQIASEMAKNEKIFK